MPITNARRIAAAFMCFAVAASASADIIERNGTIDSTLGFDRFELTHDDSTGAFRMETFGVFPTLVVSDGKTVYERDWHGAVRKLVFLEREVAVRTAALLAGLASEDDFDRTEGNQLAIGSEDQGASFSITGDFDAIERVALTGQGGIEITYISADPARTLPGKLTTNRPEPNEAAIRADAPNEISVRRTFSGHALVDVTVNGEDLGAWIFDTGAGGTVINTASAESLGLEPVGTTPVSGVGGRVQGDLFKPETLSIGPLTIKAPRLVGMDLAFLANAFGEPIAGIIGYDVLAQSVVTIVPGGDTITIRAEAPEDDGVTWVDLVTAARIPAVRATLEGDESWFRLDTGAAPKSVSVHAPAVKRRSLLEGRDTTAGQAAGVGGAVPVRRGQIESFTLAGQTWTDLDAEFATEPVGAFADPYTDGNIGGLLLKRFDALILDYAGGRAGFVISE